MLWVKALHVFFVISWFAGLLYLPRLFVYHADTTDEIGNERFKIMERKLYAMMTFGMVGSLVFGLWMLFGYAWSAYVSDGWLYAKLLCVFLLLGFHFHTKKIMREFVANKNTRNHVFYRWYNEIAAILGLVIVILVIVKPF